MWFLVGVVEVVVFVELEMVVVDLEFEDFVEDVVGFFVFMVVVLLVVGVWWEM